MELNNGVSHAAVLAQVVVAIKSFPFHLPWAFCSVWTGYESTQGYVLAGAARREKECKTRGRLLCTIVFDTYNYLRNTSLEQEGPFIAWYTSSS